MPALLAKSRQRSHKLTYRINPKHPLNTCLTGWWLGSDKTRGSVVFRSVLNKFHATVIDVLTSGSGWITEQGNKTGYELKGTDTDIRVDVHSTNFIQPTTGISTVSAWIRPTGIAPEVPVFTGQMVAGDVENAGYWGIVIANTDATGNKIWAYNWTGVETKCGAAYTPDTLFHVMRIKTATDMYLLINGELAASVSSGNTQVINNFTFASKMKQAGNFNFYRGMINDVRTWNVPLTFRQAKDYYKISRDGNEELLLQERTYWYFTHRADVFNAMGSFGSPNADFSATSQFEHDFNITAVFTIPDHDFLATAASADPIFAGTLTATTGNVELVSTGNTITPTYTATAALTTGSTDFSASVAFVAPQYTSTSVLTTAGPDFAATAASIKLHVLTLPAVTAGADFAATGFFVAPVYTSTATLNQSGTQFAAAVNYTNVLFTFTGSFTGGGVDFASASAFDSGDFASTVSLISGGAEFSAGFFFERHFNATAGLVIGGVTFSATDIEATTGDLWIVVSREEKWKVLPHKAMVESKVQAENTLVKQPGESTFFTMPFSPLLQENEVIIGTPTVTWYPTITEGAEFDMNITDITEVAADVTFRCVGGQAGQFYKTQWSANTQQGTRTRIRQIDGWIKIID